jgi:hypothetical protein
LPHLLANSFPDIDLEVEQMASIDFSLRVETEEDLLGPNVLVVRTLFNGETCKEWLPAAVAADHMMHHPLNGVVYRSARIEFHGVYDEWLLSHVPLNGNGFGEFQIGSSSGLGPQGLM